MSERERSRSLRPRPDRRRRPRRPSRWVWRPSPWRYAATAVSAALVGAVASAVAIAYLARASSTGAALDWVLAAAMGAARHRPPRGPGRRPHPAAGRRHPGRPDPARAGTWRGLPWGALRQVQHLPRRGLFRDGRLVLVVHNPERLIEELDRAGRRQSRIARKLYGAPFAVPLALSTRVTGAGGRPDRCPGPARGRPGSRGRDRTRGAGAGGGVRGGHRDRAAAGRGGPGAHPERRRPTPTPTPTPTLTRPGSALARPAPRARPRHRRHRRPPPAAAAATSTTSCRHEPEPRSRCRWSPAPPRARCATRSPPSAPKYDAT